MPRQTRSRAAKSEDRLDTSAETEDGKPAARDNPSMKRAPQIADTQRDETHFSSPRAQSRESVRAASAARQLATSPHTEDRGDWQDRGRAYRLSPSNSQEHLFSPPPYKAERYQQSQQHHHHMEYGERREYEMDLGDVRDEDMMGPDMADPLLLGPFADESPPRAERRSPEMDQGSGRKASGPSSQQRRPPPYYPHPGAGYTPSSHYRRSPRSSASQQYHHPQSPHHGHPPQHRPPAYHYGSFTPHQGSPPQGSGYPRNSPPGSGTRGGYYHGYSPYYHHFPPPPQSEHWDPHLQGAYPPPFEHDEEQIPPPPSSTKKRPAPSAMDSPGRGTGHNETPEKELKRGSPFQSPPTSAAKTKFKRSPFYPTASPNIGTYGSFGMDTPRATLGAEAFSPMGPEFSTFNDETTPFPMDDNYKLSISRSGSVDSDTPMLNRRPTNDPGSPLTGFIPELSPLKSGIQGVPRSPLRHSNVYPMDQPPSGRDRSKAPAKGTVTVSGSRGVHGSRILGSPMESSSGAKPRKLWPTTGGGATPASAGSSQAVRVELGGSGSSTRKSLEGINSMMQGRSAGRHDSTPSSHVGYPSRSPHMPPPHHHPPQPHHAPVRGYRGDLATPIKPIGHPGNQRMTPQSGRIQYGSAVKSGYPGSAHKQPYPGSAQKPVSSMKVPPSSGKENKKKSPGSSSKRSPCNCKKSKCLKLYCECFAAERFCSGCNCVDCGNTPKAGHIREKAIKDTRAKNPNAFKPRIGVKREVTGNSPQSGHNMGCRCKRSECLKKYCECFQAGVICGAKCKCVDCLNYAGSQALIDKRRKIKDQRGADFAMRVADEAWKGQPGSSRKPAAPAAPPTRKKAPPQPSPAPSGTRLPPPPHMMHPSPRGPPPPSGPHHHHPYMPPQGMMMGPPVGGPMGPMGFSPMGMPMTPAGYPRPPPMPPGEPPHAMYPPPPANSAGQHKKAGGSSSAAAQKNTPPTTTPRTPAVRVKFDPASSRKKRKLSPGSPEPTLPYFGPNMPEQPKTAALAVFSFLSNDDLYNAGLVCKAWTELSINDELWKFES